tara:strand:- start:39 stop:284 length:246 start_codon:yes stop_codon:yes gene_type:complete
MQVYEVVKTNNDGKEISYGFYRYESSANRYVAQQERYRFSNLAHEIARLVGWKRGKNAERFQEIISEMANSPYKVRKVQIQ